MNKVWDIIELKNNKKYWCSCFSFSLHTISLLSSCESYVILERQTAYLHHFHFHSMAKLKAPRRTLDSYTLKHINKTIKGNSFFLSFPFLVKQTLPNSPLLPLSQLVTASWCDPPIHPTLPTLPGSSGSNPTPVVPTSGSMSDGTTVRRSRSAAAGNFMALKRSSFLIIMIYRALIPSKPSVRFTVLRVTRNLTLLGTRIFSVVLSTILPLVHSIPIESPCMSRILVCLFLWLLPALIV